MIKLNPDQQKAIEEQKQQCPFCKIISGELPAKKVYEDDQAVAILDINPAAAGHTLVMPKEHYPIMPLIPPAAIDHLFIIVKGIMEAAYDGMLCTGVTMFIANGGAAGQQSSHFMAHVIPREDNDRLASFGIPQQTLEEKDILAGADRLRASFTSMMKNHLEGKSPVAGASPPRSMTDEGLISIIEANPQLLKIVLDEPSEFKRLVAGHPQLSQLFKDKDVDALIAAVRKKHGRAGQEKDKGLERAADTSAGGEEAPEEEQEKQQEGETDLDSISKLFK